jgi:CheY-like chemotaxis protein
MNERKKRILVVEDDADSLETLCAMLHQLGYDTIAFNSGLDLINKIRGKQLDLALLDIMMPQRNGYEVLEDLRESGEFSELPAFFVTAKDADSEFIEGYKYGADYYISKPYTKKQLEFGLNLFLGEAAE